MLKLDIRSLVGTEAARNLSIRAYVSVSFFRFSQFNDSPVIFNDSTCPDVGRSVGLPTRDRSETKTTISGVEW